MSSFVPWQCRRLQSFVLFLGLILMPAMLLAADRPGKAAKAAQAGEQVEMFEAIDKGDIAVKFIPKDSKEGRMVIQNKTDKPLSVKLPEAFGAVPVLAQVGGGNQNRNNNNQNQAMGGGMGGGGMGGGMGGGGMGMMYVAPEKAGQMKVPGVCLEHGKAEPRPNVPYEVKRIEAVTDKPGVAELCKALGAGQINQRAAQAAAWNLNNGMSWEQLAAKRLHHANGATEPYFKPQELRAAMQVAAAAVQLSQQNPQPQPVSANDSK